MAHEINNEEEYESKRMVTYISPALKKEFIKVAYERFGLKKDSTILKMAIKLYITTHTKNEKAPNN